MKNDKILNRGANPSEIEQKGANLKSLPSNRLREVESQLVLAVLNKCLSGDSGVFFEAGGRVNPNDFVIEDNTIIWNVLGRMSSAGKSFDISEFLAQPETEKLNSDTLLLPYISKSDVSAILDIYTEMVAVEKLKIYMFDLLRDQSRQSFSSMKNEIRKLEEILNVTNSKVSNPLEDVALKFLEMVSEDELQDSALEFGIKELDQIVGGIYNGRLYTIAANTGVGKSSLVSDIIRHNCYHKDNRCLLYSLEMSEHDVMVSLFSQVTGIPNVKFRNNEKYHFDMDKDRRGSQYRNPERPELKKFMSLDFSKISNIIYRNQNDISFIENEVLSLASTGKIDFAVVDHIGLTKVKGHNNKYSEVTDAVNRLKVLSLHSNIPIIMVSQLNREAVSGGKKSDGVVGRDPELYDLRDSGAIEQASDVVILLKKLEDGYRKVMVKKSRQGTLADFELPFYGQYSSFKKPDEK